MHGIICRLVLSYPQYQNIPTDQRTKHLYHRLVCKPVNREPKSTHEKEKHKSINQERGTIKYTKYSTAPEIKHQSLIRKTKSIRWNERKGGD